MDEKARVPLDFTLHWDGGVQRELKKATSPRIDNDRCINCGSCITACPTGALREMQRQICRLCPDCANSPVMFPRDMEDLATRSCGAGARLRGVT